MSAVFLEKLSAEFPDAVIEQEESGHIQMNPAKWNSVAAFLKKTEGLEFDSCMCITGVDLGVEEGLEARYNLHSMKHNHKLEIRISVSRDNPSIPTVSDVWQIANWFEREVYDMVGIIFIDHPDLRRMLLPEDWAGYPLRKDYEEPEAYHGIILPKVKEVWE